MDESYECLYYVKEQRSSTPWTCVVCHMSELQLDLGRHIYQRWEQYKLECSHIAHPRCYRVWCFQNDAVGCPSCGLLPMTEAHQNCYHCLTWGHKSSNCPILQFTYHHPFYVAVQKNNHGERFFEDERSYAERSYAERSYAERNYAERSYAERSYAERSYAERSYAERNYAERSYAERNRDRLEVEVEVEVEVKASN